MGQTSPPTKSRASQHQVALGYVSGVFGVRGELRLFLHHRESELLRQGADVWLVSPEGEQRVVHVSARAGTGGRVLGRIVGVDTPEAAQTLVGWELLIDRAALPPTAPGEYYQHDLIGMKVLTQSGVDLGNLTAVQPGEVDIWISRRGDEEFFIPAKRAVILEVDMVNGIVRVDDQCASTS